MGFELFLRDVAQPGSATVWGTGGRKFKSCHPDIKKGSLSRLPFFSMRDLSSET